MAQEKTAKKGGRPANDTESKTSSKKKTEQSSNVAMTEDQFNRLMSQFASMSQQPQKDASADDERSKDVRASFARKTNLRQAEAKKFFELMANDKKNMRIISIPKVYKDTVGTHITSNVNGVAVKVPVDSRRYPIHQAHFEAIQAKLRHIDDQVEKNQGNDRFFEDSGDYSKVEG